MDAETEIFQFASLVFIALSKYYNILSPFGLICKMRCWGGKNTECAGVGK